MGAKDHATPPSTWDALAALEITELTPDIYYGWWPDDANPTFWHWCPTGARSLDGGPRWTGAGTADHTLVSREPLHLEPSLLWPCCGTHGFVREGKWISA